MDRVPAPRWSAGSANPVRGIVAGCALLALAGVAAAPLTPAIRLAFSMVCHQAPERCFLWLGGPMPVCARCLGLYAGLLAAGIRPVRAPSLALWALAAANGFDWLFALAPNAPRFALAFAFTWLAASRLLAWCERTASN